MATQELFTTDQQQRIITAIREAERATSGEIRVHIEGTCPDPDPVQRAIQVFGTLGMHQTQQQNGVLFYLAVNDRKFAVVGDKGIDQRVPADFWNSTKEVLRRQFGVSDYVEGLCQGIELAGQQLKQFFPTPPNDTNELSDDISFD